MRICSLLPSATEIVCALGLMGDLVAVSHECDYPPQVAGKPKASNSLLVTAKMSGGRIDEIVSHHVDAGGSLYKLDEEMLHRLKPDLILTQELCHVCAVSYDEVKSACRVLEGNPRVVSLEPHNLEGIFDSIRLVGELTGRFEEAERLVEGMRLRVEEVHSRTRDVAYRPRVFCMEWIDPPWVGGHWIPELVQLAGGLDGMGRLGEASRRVAWEEILEYAPEVFVAMPCGYDARRAAREAEALSNYPGWQRLPAVKAGRVFAVDGSAYFSRSGPRIADGVEILASVIHPELVKSPVSGAVEPLITA
jgi:iron complex transport system substrate-binding protein